MKENYIMLNVNAEAMAEKSYNLSVLTLANFNGYIDIENGYRVIAKTDFLLSIKEILKLTNYKCKTVIKTFIDLGVLFEDKDNYYLNPAQTPFLKLLIPTAKYCINHLSPFIFKLYCFLLNKNNINKIYRLSENYFFSKKELLTELGYSRSQPNIEHLWEALDTLVCLGMIDYNRESVGRPGKHGTYHELYSASSVSQPQITSAISMLEEHSSLEELEEVLEDIRLPGINIKTHLGKRVKSVKSIKQLDEDESIHLPHIPPCYNSGKWFENEEYKVGMLNSLMQYPQENHDYLLYYGLID